MQNNASYLLYFNRTVQKKDNHTKYTRQKISKQMSIF
jgi:hypothetical protein